MRLELDRIFEVVKEHRASDVILVAGLPPTLWILGRMTVSTLEPLAPQDIEATFLPLLDDVQREQFNRTGDIDFAVGKKNYGRLRINLHRQRGSLSAAIRFVTQEIPTFEQLNLPPRVRDFATLPQGLVLVTGAAAMGKSTTLAAMIDYMNRTYTYHIVTLEDPIEYMFQHQKSVIEQREIGLDSVSFGSALRHVVRQRPDVVLIGEMRDLETVSAALTAVETGHLVLATLHTSSAVQTVDRIIDIFPAAQQAQVRVQLSSCLQGITCQRLFRDALNHALVPAAEILVPTQAIRRAIRDGETHLLTSMIETGKTLGMQTMDMAMSDLVRTGRINAQDAVLFAQDPEKMRRHLAA